MAGPDETLGSPWPPLAIRPWFERISILVNSGSGRMNAADIPLVDLWMVCPASTDGMSTYGPRVPSTKHRQLSFVRL
jgi:hypothetical protein